MNMPERMAQNIEYYTNSVKNKSDEQAVHMMIEGLSEILNETIKVKFVQSFEQDNEMENMAFNETSSFGAKVETCYTLQAFGMDVHAILLQFDFLKDEFQTFQDEKIQARIEEIMRLSRSDLFNLILTLVDKKRLPNIHCGSMPELLNTIGYRGTLQFIFAVLAAAMIENFLML